MNILKLKKGEWFLITPDVPHAYLQGELMECMINSDNVVRGGLTPKTKDVETLLDILPYHDMQTRQMLEVKILNEAGENSLKVEEYLPQEYKELRVLKISCEEGSTGGKV